MYPWLVFLHVVGVFGFLMAHGGSVNVAFRLRGERNLDRIRALLELSNSSFNMLYSSFLLMLISGIIAGFVGNWWGRGWIWTALGLLILTSITFFFLGTGYFNKLRKTVGLAWFDGIRSHPAETPASNEEVVALLNTGNPMRLAVLGAGALVVITWLMMFKPF
jgi:hypothetical protein